MSEPVRGKPMVPSWLILFFSLSVFFPPRHLGLPLAVAVAIVVVLLSVRLERFKAFTVFISLALFVAFFWTFSVWYLQIWQPLSPLTVASGGEPDARLISLISSSILLILAISTWAFRQTYREHDGHARFSFTLSMTAAVALFVFPFAVHSMVAIWYPELGMRFAWCASDACMSGVLILPPSAPLEQITLPSWAGGLGSVLFWLQPDFPLPPAGVVLAILAATAVGASRSRTAAATALDMRGHSERSGLTAWLNLRTQSTARKLQGVQRDGTAAGSDTEDFLFGVLAAAIGFGGAATAWAIAWLNLPDARVLEHVFWGITALMPVYAVTTHTLDR